MKIKTRQPRMFQKEKQKQILLLESFSNKNIHYFVDRRGSVSTEVSSLRTRSLMIKCCTFLVTRALDARLGCTIVIAVKKKISLHTSSSWHAVHTRKDEFKASLSWSRTVMRQNYLFRR